MEGCEWFAIDTEFIAEKYYKPLLCLIQVATPQGDALIDPLAVDPTPFWEMLVSGNQTTIAHSGRMELEFCYRYTHQFPKNIFDTQLAAGLVSPEYPIGYSNLVLKMLNEISSNSEGRTDWSCRPLNDNQLNYAMDDVRFLNPLRLVLSEELERRGRTDWLLGETDELKRNVFLLVSPERWRRILGSGRYDSQEVAIINALWHWRESVAKQRNTTVRRVLRDDLLLELARHRSSDPQIILSIRGMERSDLKKQIPHIASTIRIAMLSPNPFPAIEPLCAHVKIPVLGTLFSAVLSTLCHQLQLAPQLVATTADVRDWIAWRLNLCNFETPPVLASGWRAGIIGKVFEELLTGEKGIYITNPTDDSPLEFK